MSVGHDIFNAGTINRALPLSFGLVANNTKYNIVLTYLHFTKNIAGYPTLDLTLHWGGKDVRLLPLNFTLRAAGALDILEAGQTITLKTNEYIQATTDTENAIDFVASGYLEEPEE